MPERFSTATPLKFAAKNEQAFSFVILFLKSKKNPRILQKMFSFVKK